MQRILQRNYKVIELAKMMGIRTTKCNSKEIVFTRIKRNMGCAASTINHPRRSHQSGMTNVRTYIPDLCRMDCIKSDINAMYQLLDHLKWFDTLFQSIVYRVDNDNVLLSNNAADTRMVQYPHDDIPNLYKQILEYRNDVDVLLHVRNPDIAAVAMSMHGLLPIDQSYYMLGPVTHAIGSGTGNDDVPNILGTESRLLFMEKNGVIVLGSSINEAFTRLFYAIQAAQSQVLALSIQSSVDDVIFPPLDIQNKTIQQCANFNADGEGYLEFKAWKRRYALGNVKDTSDTQYADNTFAFDEDEYELRKEVSKAYHALDTLGWTESIYQHISAIVPSNNDAMLINAYGLEFGEVTADNLMKITMNGTILYGGNSACAGSINPAGLRLHAAVHEARADANVVIHCHHPALSAISVHEKGLILDWMESGYKEWIGSVGYHAFDSLALAVDKKVLADGLFDGSNVIILRNHGILTIGKTVQDAFNRLYYTVHAAQAQIKMMTQTQQTPKQSVNQFTGDINHTLTYDPWNRF
eukprot:48382_1